jgi:hypothetical protein
MKKKIQIVWRGWHLSPLFIFKHYTMHFTNGIAFGVKYYPGDITYYLGWLIVSKKIKWIPGFVKKVNAKTWPKGWIWIIKYGRF